MVIIKYGILNAVTRMTLYRHTYLLNTRLVNGLLVLISLSVHQICMKKID